MDQEFKIHIVSDADNAGFTSAAAASADLSKEMGVVNVSTEDVAKATGAADEAVKGFNVGSRETRLLVSELNKILPGLGMAFRGIVMAMGPFAVIILAIQAAIAWWQSYKDAVEAAATAHAKALDEMRSATHEAIEENDKFATSMEDTATAAQHINAALAEGEAVLNAQLKVKKDLREVDEKNEMAKAKTPEEKAAIKTKYEGLGDKDDAAARQAHIAELGNVMAAVQAKEKELIDQRKELEENRLTAMRADDAPTLKVYTGLMLKKDAQIEELKKEYDQLEQRQRTTINVGAIEDNGAVAAHNRMISKGVEGMDAAAHGQKLNQEQVNTNRALSEAFAHYNGGLQILTAIARDHVQNSTSLVQEMLMIKQNLAALNAQVVTHATIR